jgi:hypothetical protein
VVVLVKNVFHSDVILCKLFVTFTECSFALKNQLFPKRFLKSIKNRIFYKI